MMIEWQPRYETGILPIDEDHHRLVDLINELDAVVAGSGDPVRLGMIIDALVDYTRYHFSREEALMKSAGYGGVGDHAAAHGRFVGFLEQMIGESAAPTREAGAGIRDYLGAWLLDHILVEDMRYVSALRARD
jgi:hemerythrin-like metal-binding protein